MFRLLAQSIIGNATKQNKNSYNSNNDTSIIWLILLWLFLTILFCVIFFLYKNNKNIQEEQKMNETSTSKCEFCGCKEFIKINNLITCVSCGAEYEQTSNSNKNKPTEKPKCKFCNGESFYRENEYIICKKCGFKYKINFGKDSPKSINEIIQKQNETKKKDFKKIINYFVSGTIIISIIVLIIAFTAPLKNIEKNGILYEKNENGYKLVKCENYSEQITIPEEIRGKPVTEIGANAFYGNTNLTHIKFNKNITIINKSAFENCHNLERLDIPSNITNIEDYAFMNCTNLTYVFFQPGITRINQGVFKGCKSLENIELPNTVTSIYNEAFAECESLQTIYLPISVEYIYARDSYTTSRKTHDIPFYECNENLKIYIEAENLPFGFDKYWEYNSKGKSYFEVIMGTSLEEYKNRLNENIVIIPVK